MQWPTCSGLTMVPKLDLTPEASDAAIASAVAVCAADSPSSRAHAAAQPKTPMVAVGCQPFVYWWKFTPSEILHSVSKPAT